MAVILTEGWEKWGIYPLTHLSLIESLSEGTKSSIFGLPYSLAKCVSMANKKGSQAESNRWE